MEELGIVAITLTVVAVIAIVVIAFNVVGIRRILEGRRDHSDVRDRPSTRP
jgi:hypothetical protein